MKASGALDLGSGLVWFSLDTDEHSCRIHVDGWNDVDFPTFVTRPATLKEELLALCALCSMDQSEFAVYFDGN